jgi:hypothetical protein
MCLWAIYKKKNLTNIFFCILRASRVTKLVSRPPRERIPDKAHGVEEHAVEVAGQAARVTRHIQRGEQLHAT